MKKLFLFVSALLISGTVVADTINIKWGVDDQTFTTTTCEIGGDVVLPTPPEKPGYIFKGWVKDVFNRGTFANWQAVPSDPSYYTPDYHNNNAPLNGDYIIVEDASWYIGDYITSSVQVITVSSGAAIIKIIDLASGAEYTYDYRSVAGDGKNVPGTDFHIANNNHTFYISSSKYMSMNGTIYTTNAEYGWGMFNNVDFIAYSYTPHLGTWKFVYEGDWETNGKDGWKPVEQIVSE